MVGIKTLLFLLLPTIAISPVSPAPSGIKAGYWPSYTASNLPISAIDTSLFTHLLYAFLVPDPTTFELVVPSSEEALLHEFTSTLHQKNPPAIALLSISAGNDPTTLSRIIVKPSQRQDFIESTIEIGRKYGFDGLDLDWEFPQSHVDMDNLGLLVAEWRIAIDKEAQTTGRPPLLLSAAVYFAAYFFLAKVPYAYPAASLQKNVDWVNLMCFDYHGSWDTTATGAHAALYDPKRKVSTSVGVESWIEAGLSSGKLIMGLPLYGRTWELEKAEVHGIGAPAVGVGPGEGIMAYSEVEDFNGKMHAIVEYDEDTVSAYSYIGTSWIGYDDTTTVVNKIGYARANVLGGYFFWTISGDKNWKISSLASKAWGS